MSQLKRNRKPGAITTGGYWMKLYIVGGVAAAMVAVLLFIALIDLITTGARTGTILQDNFLVLLFKLHAEFSGSQMESLMGLNLLDIAILAFVGIMSLALYPVLRRVNKAWAIIAVCLPFVGLGLFILTHDIGRSGILGAGLIIAVIMLWSDIFSKATAYVGMLANISLLVGDIGTAFSYSIILAMFISLGYVSFIVWYVLIGLRLFQLGLSEFRWNAS